MKTDLSTYNNDWYRPGSKIKRLLWYYVNNLILLNRYNPFSSLKKLALRLFGAKIGRSVVIKQAVNVKYPWMLEIGDNSWIGEGVWIDNLAEVKIGANCCLSQGALLLCGNHNYKKSSFDLMIGRINLEEGVWIGAKSIVMGGVSCYSNALLTAGSIATKNLAAFQIYQGNPAIPIRERIIK